MKKSLKKLFKHKSISPLTTIINCSYPKTVQIRQVLKYFKKVRLFWRQIRVPTLTGPTLKYECFHNKLRCETSEWAWTLWLSSVMCNLKSCIFELKKVFSLQCFTSQLNWFWQSYLWAIIDYVHGVRETDLNIAALFKFKPSSNT